MNVYLDLLIEFGIQCDTQTLEILGKEESKPLQQFVDSKPQWDDRGQMFYTSQQIDLFGEPPSDSEWFYVLEQREESHPLALDYEDECRLQKTKSCHHYDRTLRFRFILTYLCCQAGKIPAKILGEIADEFGVRWEIHTRWYKYNFQMYQIHTFKALSKLEWDPETIWDKIRLCLKRKGLKIYYNRITVILEQFGIKGPQMTNDQFVHIMNDFTSFDLCFEIIKNKSFCYFPHLRYIALRLMDKYGIGCQYDIPILRTESKVPVLDEKFNKLHF